MLAREIPHKLPQASADDCQSQAILRFVSEQQRTVFVKALQPASYFYPAAISSPDIPNVANAILVSSLLSVTTTANSPQDIFGNVKIPYVPSLNISGDLSQWTPIPDSGSLNYSSWIGIPLNLPIGQGNVSFTMQSWYWQLANPTLSLFFNSYSNNSFNGLPNATAGWQPYTAKDGFWQFLVPVYYEIWPNDSMALVFQNANGYSPLTNRSGAMITQLSANLARQIVEMNVTCHSMTSCQANALRASSLPPGYDAEWDFQFAGQYLFMYLVDAFPNITVGPMTFDPFFSYLNNTSQNPFNPTTEYFETTRDLATLGTETLAQRLEQVINAYWIAQSALSAVTSFDELQVLQYFGSQGLAAVTRNATATFANPETFLVCDAAWLALLCASTVLMFCAAIASLGLTLLYDGPEATDFVSALTRGYRVPRLDRGSYLDGDELVRRMKDVELKLGDDRADADVGRIVIGPSQVLADLETKRLYS